MRRRHHFLCCVKVKLYCVSVPEVTGGDSVGYMLGNKHDLS